MSSTNDIAEFLTSRRANVTPEQVGLTTSGSRREEVASLAGVSVEYYKRLERGQASGVSDGVLEALARALRLDDAERSHLYDLARAANPVAPARRRSAQQRVRPVVQRTADSGLTISVYAAEPGSRSEQGLDLLASWIATPAERPASPEREHAPSPPPEA